MENVNFGLRPMRLEDISQVAEIEREAFPTTWPPTPFRKELQNRLANYLVAWVPWGEEASASTPGSSTGKVREKTQPLLQRWLTGVRELFSPRPEVAPHPPQDFIAGFVGVWFMADEAHITAIGVRQKYQRQGLGEMLMQGTVELATARRMHHLTLEARVSNYPAHALYEKYGFQKVGIRKGYYSDNHEDAVIMTASNILSSSYQELFKSLVEAYRLRRGERVRIVA